MKPIIDAIPCGKLEVTTDDVFDPIQSKSTPDRPQDRSPHRAVDFADAPWYAGASQALGIGGQGWTYTELCELVAERVDALRDQGLGAGQVVLCDAKPGLDLIRMQYALARIGAALLPVRPDMPASARAALIRQTGTEWHWFPVAGGGTLEPTAQAVPRSAGLTDTPSERLALLIQTSGSSGASKAVMLPQTAVLASCAMVNRVLELGPGDQWLCCLPLQHVGGLAIGYRCALAGAALRLQTGLAGGFDVVALASDLARYPVTHLSLVPPMLARLLDTGMHPPASLRVLLVGGQALHSTLADRAIDSGWPLHVTYGMSETFSQIATGRYLPVQATAARIGPLLPGVEADCGRCDEAPRVLRLGGPMVMSGYANPKRRPGEGLNNGWLHTADLACLDADEVLHLFGRADDVLVIGAVNVLPSEVEEQLAKAPGLDAVAVVGVPHPVWGLILAACYTGNAGQAEIEHWCRMHLASSVRPRIFVRCSQLPLLDSGKWDRTKLAALASAAGEAGIA